MTFNQLKYVIEIAKAGSINKASQTLYISQPSLTSAIQELEKELGIQIFVRSGRGVALTSDGEEFIIRAQQIIDQVDQLQVDFGKEDRRKKKFGISCQHYSFAIKAFVEMVKTFGMDEYEFAIRETKTRSVIEDVRSQKSEIGILYLNDFNKRALLKILGSNDLAFHPLIQCQAFVYLSKKHPLASQNEIGFDALKKYPNLAFEQGGDGSFYFSEEILSTLDYPQTIKVNDRATMLNLMVGLNGYTLCSGIICEELNGDDFITVPLRIDPALSEGAMEIGYIQRKDHILSPLALTYIQAMKQQLNIE